MKKIPRPCSVYPCSAAAEVRGKCRPHARQADADRNQHRARSLAVYRSGRWRRLRKRILLERPWCEEPSERCDAPATDLDHVTPIEDGGDPWDETNLRPLCHRHHSRKTRTVDQPRRLRKSAQPQGGRGVAIAQIPAPRTAGESSTQRRRIDGKGGPSTSGPSDGSNDGR